MIELVCKTLAATLRDDGQLAARFSTDAVDRDGDVVLPTAFTDGQAVPLAAFGHSWDRLPIGKGIVRVEPHGARFEGRFLDHPEAQATRDTLRALGELAQWSFGFSVLDAQPDTRDGRPIRLITALELHEVSPVLVAANPYGTGTLAVRAAAADPAQAERRRLRAEFRRLEAGCLEKEIAALEQELAAQVALGALRDEFYRSPAAHLRLVS